MSLACGGSAERAARSICTHASGHRGKMPRSQTPMRRLAAVQGKRPLIEGSRPTNQIASDNIRKRGDRARESSIVAIWRRYCIGASPCPCRRSRDWATLPPTSTLPTWATNRQLVRIEFHGYGSGRLVAELDARSRWSVRGMEGQAVAIGAQVPRYLQLVHRHPIDPLLPWIGAEVAPRSAFQALGMGKITSASDGSVPFDLSHLRQRGYRADRSLR